MAVLMTDPEGSGSELGIIERIRCLLASRGYASGTVEDYLITLRHFQAWMENHGNQIEDATSAYVLEYLARTSRHGQEKTGLLEVSGALLLWRKLSLISSGAFPTVGSLHPSVTKEQRARRTIENFALYCIDDSERANAGIGKGSLGGCLRCGRIAGTADEFQVDYLLVTTISGRDYG